MDIVFYTFMVRRIRSELPPVQSARSHKPFHSCCTHIRSISLPFHACISKRAIELVDVQPWKRSNELKIDVFCVRIRIYDFHYRRTLSVCPFCAHFVHAKISWHLPMLLLLSLSSSYVDDIWYLHKLVNFIRCLTNYKFLLRSKNSWRRDAICSDSHGMRDEQ